jgi:transposase
METLTQFFERQLNLGAAWRVTGFREEERRIEIEVVYASKDYVCPICGVEAKPHGQRTRRLRYLDFWAKQTVLNVAVPKVVCPTHSYQELEVDFAAKNSRYTMAFESKLIVELHTRTTEDVAQAYALSWGAVHAIKTRAVIRGTAKRLKIPVEHIGIDETSYRKGRKYITVIVNKLTGDVLEVLEGKDAKTVGNWLDTQRESDFSALKSVSMDMSNSYAKAIKDKFGNANELICHDRFHVSQILNKALDKVRHAECAELNKVGKDNPLKGTRFGWLFTSSRLDNRGGKRRAFLALTRQKYKTARAWRIKETAAMLWDYQYMGAARKGWKALLWWMSHSRLPDIIRAGRTIKARLDGILNAIRLKTSNALLESTNSLIQRIKVLARGYRNKESFRLEILFHFGGLNMEFER